MQTKKYILVLRCSTEEQSRKGNSLETQRTVCESHPRTNNLKQVATFEEVVSSFKNARRGIIEKVFYKCKARPGLVDFVLYQKVDRYFRNTETAWRWIKRFKEIGVEINFIEQWIEYNAGGGRLMLNLRLGIAEEESFNTSRRTRQNLNAIKERGYYIGTRPPRGFRKEVLPNYRKTLRPDSTDVLQVLQFIFRSYLYGNVTRSHFLDAAKQIGFTRSRFYETFRNQCYAGLNKITINGETKLVRAEWYEHRIIEPDEYDMIIEKTASDKSPAGKTVVRNKFWLKGHIVSQAGEKLTASSPRGRTKRYSYYHNVKKGHRNIPTAKAHGLVYEFFKSIRIKPSVLEYMTAEIERQLTERKTEKHTQTAIIKRDLAQIEERLSEINKQFAIGEITTNEFREYKNIIGEQKEQRLARLDELKTTTFLDTRVLSEAVGILPNVLSHLKAGTQAEKDIILKAFFPLGFYVDLENNVLGTERLNKMIHQVIDDQAIKNKLLIKSNENVEIRPLGVKDRSLLESENDDILRLCRLVRLKKTA